MNRAKGTAQQIRAQDSAFVQQCSLMQLRQQLPLRWPTPVGLPGSPKKSYLSGYRYPWAEVCREPGQVQAWLDLGDFDRLSSGGFQRAAAGAGATITQLNAPFKNPIEEIEVTDPTHPLFGRVFRLITVLSQMSPGTRHMLVSYRENMNLRIPIEATNLVSFQLAIPSKLTRSALQELLSLAEQYEVLLCPANPTTSGDNCPQHAKPKFSPNLSSSSKE